MELPAAVCHVAVEEGMVEDEDAEFWWEVGEESECLESWWDDDGRYVWR